MEHRRLAGPLAETLEVIPEHFKHFPLDDKFTAVHVRKLVPANWKIAMERIRHFHALLDQYLAEGVQPAG